MLQISIRNLPILSILGSRTVPQRVRALPQQMRIYAVRCANLQQAMPKDDCVCRACGTGDNTVGHWSRWCIAPIIVACHLLKTPFLSDCLNQIAGDGDRNTAVCSLVVAQFRRLLRQEGAFLHQDACLAKPSVIVKFKSTSVAVGISTCASLL